MDIFGIGFMELAVVLVVALIFVGPTRMVQVARTLGSFWQEAQKTLRMAADAATVKLDDEPSGKDDPPGALPAPDGAVARTGSAASAAEGASDPVNGVPEPAEVAGEEAEHRG